jgi:hypothetical protein
VCERADKLLRHSGAAQAAASKERRGGHPPQAFGHVHVLEQMEGRMRSAPTGEQAESTGWAGALDVVRRRGEIHAGFAAPGLAVVIPKGADAVREELCKGIWGAAAAGAERR